VDHALGSHCVSAAAPGSKQVNGEMQIQLGPVLSDQISDRDVVRQGGNPGFSGAR